MSDDTVTITVGGNDIVGWQDVEVTLRAEAFPNDFAIGASATEPVLANVKPGAPCVVKLGSDVVVTGYVDRVTTTCSGTSHGLQITGRGKTQDLVDCSAEWPTHQLIEGDALAVAAKLAQPYGIKVVLGEGAKAGEKIPAVLLNYGETAAEIIQRVARNAGLLAFEDAAGVLTLATAGAKKASSGIAYGGNLQAWSSEGSMDGRYSDYVCCALSMDALMDLPGQDFFHREKDPNVPRHRQLDLVLEVVATDPYAFTIKRAQWEAARRAGRSTVLRATVDSWRDEKGKLWAPNTLVPVKLPGNVVGDAPCCAEVTFRRSNESGTTADLVLLPPQAFTPQPIVLQPVNTADLGPTPA